MRRAAILVMSLALLLVAPGVAKADVIVGGAPSLDAQSAISQTILTQSEISGLSAPGSETIYKLNGLLFGELPNPQPLTSGPVTNGMTGVVTMGPTLINVVPAETAGTLPLNPAGNILQVLFPKHDFESAFPFPGLSIEQTNEIVDRSMSARHFGKGFRVVLTQRPAVRPKAVADQGSLLDLPELNIRNDNQRIIQRVRIGILAQPGLTGTENFIP